MSARVTVEMLDHAIAWLNCNEGRDGESDACHAVARMLEREIANRLNEKALREIAAQSGVPVARARAHLRKLAQEQR